MSKTYKTEGVILKRINFGESDKILTIFSKHYGKIRCIAKGIRKLTSRKSGNLELFNYVSVFLAKGRNLDIVTEVQLINSFSKIRNCLDRVSVAYHLNELVDRFTGDWQRSEEVFNLLIRSLVGLTAKTSDCKKLEINFKKELLNISGFGLPIIINEENINKHIETITERKLRFYYD